MRVWRWLPLLTLLSVGLTIRPALSAPATADGAWYSYTRPERFGHDAVYDSRRGRMVILGGGTSDRHLDDAWSQDLAGSHSWKRLDTPTSGMPAMDGARAFYDRAGDRILVVRVVSSAFELGTLTGSDSLVYAPLTIGGLPPSNVVQPRWVFDSQRRRLLMFGLANAYSDTATWVWALDLLPSPSWHPLSISGTLLPPRQGASVAYDSRRDRVVLFGGYGSAPGPFPQFDSLTDVNVLPLTGPSQWQAVSVTGTVPPKSLVGPCVYDSLGDRLIFPRDRATASSYALALSGTPRWSQISGVQGYAPDRGSLVFDSNRQRAVTLVSIPTAIYPVPRTAFVTTELNTGLTGANLYYAPADSTPRLAASASLMFDALRDRFLLIEERATGYALWSFGGDDERWSVEPMLGAPAIEGYWKSCYDALRDRIIVQRSNQELWEITLAGTPSWRLLPVSGTAVPPVGAELDPVEDRLVGHYGASGTWQLSLHDPLEWRPMTTTGADVPESVSRTAYDPLNHRVVFQGYSGAVNGVWALDNANTWSRLAPAGTNPAATAYLLATDFSRDRLLSGTWQLPSSGGSWSALAPSGRVPAVPIGSTWNSAYDPLRDRLFVYTSDGQSLGLRFEAPMAPFARNVPDLSVVRGERLTRLVEYVNYQAFPQQVVGSVTLDHAGGAQPATPGTTAPPMSQGSIPIGFIIPDDAPVGSDSATVAIVFVNTSIRTEHRIAVEVQAPPAEPQLSFVTPDPAHVLLAWARSSAATFAIVERRGSTGDWVAIGQAVVTPTAFTFDDATVRPQTTYAYRLHYDSAGQSYYTLGTTVVVPADVVALSFAGANPAREITVSTWLPDATPGRIEAFDLLGRQVFAQDVGPGRGRYVTHVGGSGLRSGMYLVRLTRAGRAQTLRAVVVR